MKKFGLKCPHLQPPTPPLFSPILDRWSGLGPQQPRHSTPAWWPRTRRLVAPLRAGVLPPSGHCWASCPRPASSTPSRCSTTCPHRKTGRSRGSHWRSSPRSSSSPAGTAGRGRSRDQPRTDDFMVDNCKNIYFAGHETSAATAMWCLMLLTTHLGLLWPLGVGVGSLLLTSALPARTRGSTPVAE